MKDLFFPYYVNKGRLLDIYAILNRGYSEYEELTLSSNTETRKSDKGEVSIESGFKLFKIGGKAADEKTKTNSDETTISVKKVQTIPSILKIVLEELRQKNYIKEITSAGNGDFVEIESVSFQINSVKYLMDETDELLRLIENMSSFCKASKTQKLSDYKNFSKSIRAICNGEEVLYQVQEYAVFGNVYNECLYQSVKSDLINSEFSCLCQVKRKHENGTTLMKNTVFTKIKDANLKKDVIDSISKINKNDSIEFDSIAVAEITDKPVYEIEIIALYK